MSSDVYTAVYTAVVTAPVHVNYSKGTTFNGYLAKASVSVVYTLGTAVSGQNGLTLTAVLSGLDQTIDAFVFLPYLQSTSTVTPTPVAATLIRSSATDPGSNLLTGSASSTAQTSGASSTPQAITSSASNNVPTTSTTASTSSPLNAVSSSSPNAGGITSSQGHNTTELIGVAIGVLVAGALIAALITFMIMRRKNRKNSRGYNSVQGRPSLQPVAGEAMVVDGKSWQRHLPQSESDHTTGRSTTELFDQIELHVENFYTNRMVEMQSTTVDQPSQLLSDAISSGLRPTSAIKYVMATIVLSSIDFQGNSEYILLPADYNTVNAQAGYTKPGFDQAISQWRTLTAYLGANTLQTETYLSERERKIAAITNQLCRTFQPWLQSDNNSCHQSTHGILRRGSDLGVMLFSQPASFLWDWGKDQQRRGERRTILPGLLKMTDEAAQPLTKHVCLVKRRTET